MVTKKAYWSKKVQYNLFDKEILFLTEVRIQIVDKLVLIHHHN